jgi:hypothetical protein
MNEDQQAANRFTELSPQVRKFMAGLDEDDLAILKTVIDTFRALSAWCRVTRWLFLGAIGLLFMLSQSLDAIKNLLGQRSH